MSEGLEDRDARLRRRRRLRRVAFFIAVPIGIIAASVWALMAAYVWEKLPFLRNPGPGMGFWWAVAWSFATWVVAVVVLVSSTKRAYQRLGRIFIGDPLYDDLED